MNQNKLCAILGETPDELPFGYDEDYPTCLLMKQQLVASIFELFQRGVRNFVCTGRQGVEMWAAEACIAMRELGMKLTLTCVREDESLADRWHPERRERYFRILEEADQTVERHLNPASEDENPETYISDHFDCLLVMGNPGTTDLIAEAERRNLPILKLDYTK